MKHIKLYHLLFLATIAVFVVSSCKKKDKVAPAPTFDNAASITAGYGDTITIKGTNLQNTIGSTTVRLNGQIFSIVKSSNNNVQVLVPKLAGNGQLSISVSGQTYDGPQFTYKYKGIVTTFAGSGTPGNADGKGTAASFNQPWGLAIDSTGNIFVADGGNRAIRKITPDGTVSTIFSLGTTIPVNSFEVPYHIAVNNNTHVLYVTSSYSGNLLVINPDNSVNLVTIGNFALTGIAVGGDGSIYVGDNLGVSGSTILKIGTALQSPSVFTNISSPISLAFDKTGTLYVGGQDPDPTKLQAIYKISSTGSTTLLYDDLNDTFYDIAVDQNDNVFQVEFGLNDILIIDKNGKSSVLAGNGNGVAGNKDGIGMGASFDGPHGIVCDNNGNLYVSTFNASTGAGEIRKIVVE